jgi:ABC-type iron transport system FetAB ATPase subunit
MTPQENAALPIETAAPRLQALDVCSSVVAPLSFSLRAGQCLAIAGPSGAGKTRLLRLLADLDEGGGDVLLDGLPRSAFSAPDWRAKVLYQGAESAWWRPSVLEHFPRDEHEAAVSLAARLALGAERMAADISQLSSGERQRAALVRALLKRPTVLMLDEPSSALDPDNVERMESLLLERLRGGMAMLLVTHSKEQAQRLADGAIKVSRR